MTFFQVKGQGYSANAPQSAYLAMYWSWGVDLDNVYLHNKQRTKCDLDLQGQGYSVKALQQEF